ncbi:AMP-binding protein [Streptomyces spongiae]|uniref:Fatty acyl-AMP ligase n=1 Tax=Streptomyces spongiae TaxID=565072 RepID=A0A5N8X8Y8_9ACTN|nr:AMP-binding protein [Streptomyces spongiae]MPY55903.1 fatty acyl-AMP ligase [Streptomyces spongiae]
MRESLTTLREQAASNPQQPVMTFASEVGQRSSTTVCSRALDRHSKRIASWLQEGLSPGERALLLYSPEVEFTTAFSACVYSGVIAVPAPLPGRYRHERRRLAAIARDAGVRVSLTQLSDLPEVEKCVAEEGVAEAVCHSTDTDAGDPDAWTAPEVSPKTVALLRYTSGSTGDPRGVVVSHGSLTAQLDRLVRALGIGPDVACGGWIPLYDDMGPIGLMLTGVLYGSGYVQMDPMAFLRHPHNWLRLLDEFDVQVTASPDFGYELCLRRVTDEQLAGLDLSRVAVAVNGSEPVRPATVTRFFERYAAEALLPMYGLADVRRALGRAAAAALTAEAVNVLSVRSVHTLPGELNAISTITKAYVPTLTQDTLGSLGEPLGVHGFLTSPAGGGFAKLERDHRICAIFDGSTAVNRAALLHQMPRLARQLGRLHVDSNGLRTAADLTAPLPPFDPGQPDAAVRRGMQRCPGPARRGEPAAAGRAGGGGRCRRATTSRTRATGDRVGGLRPGGRGLPGTDFTLAECYERAYAYAACLLLWLENPSLRTGRLGTEGLWLRACLTFLLGEDDTDVHDILAGVLLTTPASEFTLLGGAE